MQVFFAKSKMCFGGAVFTMAQGANAQKLRIISAAD
jgi:hypothetical protein